MGCRRWWAVLVVNEWNIDRPLFLKVGRERGRELVQAKGARMPPPSMTDTTHTHTHRQSRQHSHASCQTARTALLAGCPAFVTGRRVPGSTIWLPLD